MTIPTVRKIYGQLVPDDPVAKAVSRHNCILTFLANIERVEHFVKRAAVLGRTAEDTVIVLINVDDIHGREMADGIMPGYDWQQYRDQGLVPFARGLAEREGIQRVIDLFDSFAGDQLRQREGLAVVVVDHGVAAIYPAPAA